MPVTIRHATPADALALASLAAETFTHTFGHLYTPADLTAFLEEKCSETLFRQYIADPAHPLLVAETEQNNELAAYALGGPLALPVTAPTTPAAEIHRLYVSPRHQGKGLGKLMMETLLAEPPLTQAAALYLGVWEHNPRAQNLYRSFGFKTIGEHIFYVGNHADRDLIMERKTS